MDSVKYGQVVVLRPLPGPLTYSIPLELVPTVQVGSHVKVPFRSGTLDGFVVSVSDTLVGDSKFEVKEISEQLFTETLFSEDELTFFKWISDYYQLPIGEVFHSAFPKSVFSLPKNQKKKEARVFSGSPSTLSLTVDQSEAIQQISDVVESRSFASFLLFGVTGSGKTEVYLRAAAKAIELNRSALILVPEIALTPQLTKRFEERFGSSVAVLHSGLTEKERREQWWSIRKGEKKVVVGARSALFAPLDSLGLIVVDEEHEPSYKQEDRLRYNARDLALVRGKISNAAVVLGSATPALETFYAAKNGRHRLIELKSRPNERPMPKIEVIDMKGVVSHFSDPMRAGIERALKNGNQCMVFVNRKGYANFLLCADCGEVPKCLNCSVSLTYYRGSGSLRCHYCNFQVPSHSSCKSCTTGEMKNIGFGTEAVESDLKNLFPAARVGRLDAETVDTKKKLDTLLSSFRSGEIDILVGTQMLAKGHDFPNVTFIGIVLADTALHLPDFRAAERTFQLITQVAGRAGRSDKEGSVVLQTYVPDHYAITSAAKQSYTEFYDLEIAIRQEFGYPPFSKMAQIEFRHLNEAKARTQALSAEKILHAAGADKIGVEYLGPAAAAISRIANQHRWQMLLKSAKSSSLNAVIKTLRKAGVRFIDVDPVSTL